jgi:hypothetical protein
MGVEYLESPTPEDSPALSDVVLERVNYSTINKAGSFDGYNLFVLNERDRHLGNGSNVLVIMDMNGNIVTERQVGTDNTYDCSVEFIDPNTILMGTELGATIWHLENDSMQYLGFSGHHEYEYNPNSNTVFTFVRDHQTIGGTDYLFDTIMEYDLNGGLVWSWDVSDFISKDWWCPSHDMAGGYRDISHSNTLYYIAEEDVLYYNARNPNTFFKLNHSSKEVIWGLGEYGNFTLYDLQGNVQSELFYHAHSVEPVDDSTFILFDNDYHNQTDSLNKISRILEIKIDETTMTANESWYYEAPRIYFSAGWGDADRLANSNRLGTWGYPSTPYGAPSASLIEMDSNHKVVWRADFEHTSNHYYGIYRMERFRYRPTISSPADIVTTNSTYEIAWDAWYNYRNKRDISGNYTLYVDGVVDQSGAFEYASYWRSTTLRLTPGLPGFGTHNVTLEIDDGYGHKTSDSVSVTVNDFYIDRTGRTNVEKGQLVELPTWSGDSLSPFSYNITLNGTLHDEGTWTGQDIILSPALIDLGVHSVEFRLYNASELRYTDLFSLEVDPAQAPQISPLQATDLEKAWDAGVSLAWFISDSTPSSWSLLVEGAEVSSGDWTEQEYVVSWEVPQYPEGYYNVTLVARDILDQSTRSETNLTVTPPNYPVILSAPEDQTIAWGSVDISFLWELYGAETWMLWRNGTHISSGVSNSVNLSIASWHEEGWRSGSHNLTLNAMKDGNTTSHTFWLTIVADPGDPYADEVVADRSVWYLNGENAIGSPDGVNATVFVDYENGYLTLDMGKNEEIVDGSGDDFSVMAAGGDYFVSVTDSLSTPFTSIGSGSGVLSLDLSSSGFSEVRYVRITYQLGPDIRLDAIVAMHYNTPPLDVTPPYLALNEGVESLELAENTTITWNASDQTPWSYEIYLNSLLVETDFWYGSSISYFFNASVEGQWNVTLIVYDAFGNWANDTVTIQVCVPSSGDSGALMLLGGFAIGGIVLVAFFLWLKKR